MKKRFIKVIFGLIIIFVLLSVVIMLAVNSGLTNEKSWVWRHISLEKNNLEILKEEYISEENKEFELMWVVQKIQEEENNEEGEVDEEVDKNNENEENDDDDKIDVKLKFCKKEVLSAVDNALNFVLESNVDIIFSHVELLVWNIKPQLVYCINSNKEWNYSYQTLKWMVNSYIDLKYIDNVVTDVYNYDSYHYIRNFLDNSVTKDYFNKVIQELDNVSEDELKSIIMIEQIRWSLTNRWFFKQMVKNNLLQSFTDFSLWISWIKPTTAIEIEKYLKDPSSEFYLWKKYETLLDYDLDNNNISLQDRLTENKTYYYQYLYTWLAIKMIKKQWEEKWYNLDDKMWLVATIYNLWFKKSKPNDYPWIWGSIINIDWKNWYFWELWEKIWISLQRYKN